MAITNSNKEGEENKEEEEKKEETQLVLGNDIYSYTFFKFATGRDVKSQADLMMLCFLTIIIQVTLMIAKYSEIEKMGKSVYRGDAYLNVVRIVCSFFMHLMQYPAIRQSLQMIQYAVLNQ